MVAIPVVVKRALQALLALVVGGVAACDDAPQTVVTYMRPGGTWPFFDYATRSGPLLVQVATAPQGYSVEGVAPRLATAVAGAIQRKVFSTTTEPGQAPAPDYRLVFGFDLPTSTAADRLCDGSVLQRDPEEATIRVLGAFCHKADVQASAIGSLPRRGNDDGTELAAVVAQMTRVLISEDSAR